MGFPCAKKGFQMTYDPTEAIRREQIAVINHDPGSREYLAEKHGQTWDTRELQQDFQVFGFLAPCVTVRRKSDGQLGSLLFQHNPRLYFSFSPDE